MMVDENALAAAKVAHRRASLSTTPTGSWPSTSGALRRMYQGMMSPEQMPQARARIRISSAPGAGRGSCSTRISPKS